MVIRAFIPGEEAVLRQVFMSSVHGLARGFYSKAQLAAWAPSAYDERQWAEKIAALRPFVAVLDDQLAGYADLQASGCIDHFFVSGPCADRGVGSALMTHLHEAAAARAIPLLHAHVSLAAESFFSRKGFEVSRRQAIRVNGETLANALMVKRLAD